MAFVQRSEIVTELLETFPVYLKNEDRYTKMRFLSEHYGCKCTDCDGHDSVMACKIEEAYCQLEKVIQNTEL